MRGVLPWLVLLLVSTLLTLVVPTASADQTRARTKAETDSEPLRVDLEQLTPSVLRDGGQVTLRGTVTNESNQRWTTINVHSFRSVTPITDTATLAAAADLPVEEYVGDRITTAGTFFTIPTLDPNESAEFTATIPAGELAGGDGVYWVGVHALGQTDSQPRDSETDGRARTFLPVMSTETKPLPAAMVLPLRSPVHHDADGRVSNPGGWARRLGPGGRLYNLLQAGQEAGSRPITWLVDPAVPHVAVMLAAGNPATTLDPVATAEGEAETDPSTSPSPTAQPEEPAEEVSAANAAAAAAAQSWLALFNEEMAAHPVLALPYGDVDASALVEHDSDLLHQAVARSAEVMADLGVTATPALAAPDGYLSPDAIASSGPETLILLSDQALDTAETGGTVPSTGRILERTFATTSSGVADGGPGPEPPGGPVAVRQRVVSEAALRLLSDDRSPLVVAPPPTWDPATGSAELYSTFDEGLLKLQPLGDLVTDGFLPDTAEDGSALSTEESLPPEALIYGDEQSQSQLPAAGIRSVRLLLNRATTLNGVLTQPSALVPRVRDSGLCDISYFARRRPEVYRSRTARSLEWVEGLMGRIAVQAPSGVTMSSDHGAIGVTVSNDLDVPVAVRVKATSSSNLRIEETDPLQLAPRSRRRVLLQATAARQGVQSVTLRVTDEQGAALGEASTFSVRTAPVSGFLWVIMGGGLVMLFGAIAFRLYRRVRARRREAETESAETG